MSNLRYRKAEFKKLDGGSGHLYYDKNNPNRLHESNLVKPNESTKLIELAENFVEIFDVANYYSIGENTLGTTSVLLPSGKILHLVINNSTSKVCILECDNSSDATPTEIHAFTTNSDRAYIICYYKEKVIIFYRYNTNIYFAYSTDDGATMTHDSILNYGTPYGYYISDDDTLFVFTWNRVIYTTDGINWTVFHELAEVDDDFTGFTEIDGEYYAFIHNDYGKSSLIKFDDDNNIVRLRLIENRAYGSIYSFNNKIFIASYSARYIYFYIWDKAELTFLYRIYSGSTLDYKFLYADYDYLYFYTDKKLYRINRDDGIYLINTLDKVLINLLPTSDSLCYTLSDYGNKKLKFNRAYFYSSLYAASGNFKTPYVRERQVPAYLIVTHKPLAANTSIVITADDDISDAYATTIKTINTDGVSRTVIDLRSLLDECDFLSFKFVLADSSNVNGVEDLEITYLYQPAGLENSKV